MENEVFSILLENKSEIISAVQALIISIYFVSNLSNHGEERLERILKQMSKYINKTVKKDTLRNDWFPDNEISNQRIPRRLLDKTIKEIINDSEERKSEYIAKFWVNICLTSNSDIDEATAFSYLETIESLSWQQLCIIKLAILHENLEVDITSINDNDVQQMSQDKRTRFYSIGRDYQILMDNHYIQSVDIPRDTDNQEPFLQSPTFARASAYIHRLYLLMNLEKIPIEEIEKTFSIWNVRRKN